MKNVDVKVEGSKVILTVDATKEFGRSASGKTTIIASTEGNQQVAVGNAIVTIGLNVYKK